MPTPIPVPDLAPLLADLPDTGATFEGLTVSAIYGAATGHPADRVSAVVAFTFDAVTVNRRRHVDLNTFTGEPSGRTFTVRAEREAYRVHDSERGGTVLTWQPRGGFATVDAWTFPGMTDNGRDKVRRYLSALAAAILTPETLTACHRNAWERATAAAQREAAQAHAHAVSLAESARTATAPELPDLVAR